MVMRSLSVSIALVLCIGAPVSAAMFTINNPAENISNPADKMYNPATQVNNPASNIYNPANRTNNPNALSPPTQKPPQPSATDGIVTARSAELSKDQPRAKPVIPHKSYNFKLARTYITAAKKAFVQDEYIEFLSITEDALRRINAGSLKASRKTKQRLAKYKELGYGLLEQED